MMEVLSELGIDVIFNFCYVAKATKAIKSRNRYKDELEGMLKRNPNLIHSDYRNFEDLNSNKIAQIFIENRDKIFQIFIENCDKNKRIFPGYKFSNNEQLYDFKDETEIKLFSHLINIKVEFRTMYEKFRDAVKRADVTMAKMLMKRISQFHGLKFFCKNCDQQTSITCYLHGIVKTSIYILSDNQVLEYEVLVETVKLLLQAGSNVNDPCTNGCVPLTDAILFGKSDFAVFLVEMGARVNIINTEANPKNQPLHWAVYNYGGISLVKKIIEKGADVDALDEEGISVLHYACLDKLEDYIDLLLRKGANINIRSSEGQTPFGYLIEMNHYGNFIKGIKIPCVESFLKEIAKAKFESREVCEGDLRIIRNNINLNDYFEKCSDQLGEMKRTVFHPPFSYYHVLNMRNENVKKLANLLRNKNFIRNFEANLSSTNLYYEDLMINYQEATNVRDKYIELERTLVSAIKKYVPIDLIKYIIEFIGLQDLPSVN